MYYSLYSQERCIYDLYIEYEYVLIICSNKHIHPDPDSDTIYAFNLISYFQHKKHNSYYIYFHIFNRQSFPPVTTKQALLE